MPSRMIISVACLALTAALAPAEQTRYLATLRAGHPRVLLTTDRQKQIQDLARTDPLLAKLIARLEYDAKRTLGDAPVVHKLVGPRLLDQSRKCLGRVATLSLAHRLTGNKVYAERAIKEMLTAANFPDWNPRHFLDVAEMTAALAIGYDWLYEALDKADRKTLREAIVDLGLRPALKCYQGKGGWAGGDSNWNQVCNGGMTLGALALADEEPELAETILARAVASLPRAMQVYAPDGAYPEGPGYWAYGTSYACLMLAALDAALGTDFGLSKAAAFDKAGLYRIHTIGPDDLYFNYPDCGTTPGTAAAMFYLSARFDRPLYAWWHRQRLEAALSGKKDRRKSSRSDRLNAMEIVWYDPRGQKPSPAELPLDAFFRNRQDVVAMRSAWDDPKALYVGFKGGDNQANHGHLDIGSFVLIADGVRWAMDLGSDEYNLPGYFDRKPGGKRWGYYRMNNRGHNTLVIDDRIQDQTGGGKVVAFRSAPREARAVVDMTAAYKGQADRVLRGVAMLDRSAVLVRDEVSRPVGPVRWGMVVNEDIKCSIDGAVASLTHRDGKLTVKILEPAGATFQVLSTKPPTAEEEQNEGTFMLAAVVKPAGGDVTISVLLQPVGKGWKAVPPPPPTSLSRWK